MMIDNQQSENSSLATSRIDLEISVRVKDDNCKEICQQEGNLN